MQLTKVKFLALSFMIAFFFVNLQSETKRRRTSIFKNVIITE